MSTITAQEAIWLADKHYDLGSYHADCRSNQRAIAKKKPLYTFGDKQSEKDWLNAAEKNNQLTKYHRERARAWLAYTRKSNEGK